MWNLALSVGVVALATVLVCGRRHIAATWRAWRDDPAADLRPWVAAVRGELDAEGAPRWNLIGWTVLLAVLIVATLLLISGCASVPVTAPPPGPAELGRAEDCSVTAPCSKTDGVWMPAPLASHLAGAETRWRACRESLERLSSPAPSATGLGLVCAGCAVAAAGLCAVAR